MFIPICYAVICCFIWGFVFIIPSYLHQFSSVEIALGRYFFYSTFSIFFLLLKNFKIPKYPLKVWLKALTFSLITTVLFYIFVVASSKYSSPLIPTLFLGLSPITIIFYENFQKGQSISKLKPLILPMFLTVSGLILVNYSKIINLEMSSDYIYGIVLSIIPLAIWSWFVVANADFLRKNPSVASDWGALIGATSAVWVILFASLGLMTNHLTFEKFTTFNQEVWVFVVGSAILGILCTCVANNLWNVASSSLPVMLAAQLIILETVFGLLYVYLMENKTPEIFEALGIIFVITAVMQGISFHAKSKVVEAVPFRKTSKISPFVQLEK